MPARDGRSPSATRRPKVGVFGLGGCGGDHQTLLDLLDGDPALAESMELVERVEAEGPGVRLQLALVEGVVVSRRDEASLLEIRSRSDRLVALGTCAMHGGIPVMDRDHDREAVLHGVYGAAGAGYDTYSARPLHEVVRVDEGLPGCPVEPRELLEALCSLLHDHPPLPRRYPVCTECKVRETPCLLVDPDAVCLGPVTAAGCEARCPALGIGCAGCRGPAVDANWPSAMRLFLDRGVPRDDLVARMRTFARTPVGVTRVPSWGGTGPA